jgi:hypothetical protein
MRGRAGQRRNAPRRRKVADRRDRRSSTFSEQHQYFGEPGFKSTNHDHILCLSLNYNFDPGAIVAGY